MAGIKDLAKDTAIYGMSSIIGRFLNWCLVPIYTRVLTNAADYGVVNYLYGLTAFALVFLTYGMETGFFRFANKEGVDPRKVYSTTLLSIGATTLLFLMACLLFLEPISETLKSGDHPDFILMMIAIVSMDAFASIPFVYLRFQNKALRFAMLKMVFVGLNIGLNLFFLNVCPPLFDSHPEWISWFYSPGNEIAFILWANVLSTGIVTLLQLPEILQAKWEFDFQLWRKMLSYSLPLLILGLAGIISQTVDKIVYPFVIPDQNEAMYQLGIYGANFKIAVVLVMFTQAFRFAYEPFIFSQGKTGIDQRKGYADAMKYFIIISLIIFLGIMCYMDLLKYIIGAEYHEGLKVVPIVMMAQLLFGIYFNLSLWYKLSDQTRFGAYFSTVGCLLTVGLNIWLVPIYGYVASAWASLIAYLVITLLSYFVGQKYYRIDYDLRTIGLYAVLFGLLYSATDLTEGIDSVIIRLSVRTVIFIGFVAFFIKKDVPVKDLKTVIAKFKLR